MGYASKIYSSSQDTCLILGTYSAHSIYKSKSKMFFSCLLATSPGPNYKWPCHRQFGLGQELLVKIETSLLGLHPESLCLFNFFWEFPVWCWQKPKGMLVQRETTFPSWFLGRPVITQPWRGKEKGLEVSFPQVTLLVTVYTPNWLLAGA